MPTFEDPYQARIGQAAQRAEIAKMLTQQGMSKLSGPGGKMVGDHFVADSPLNAIAGLISSVGGAWNSSEAVKDSAAAGVERQKAVGSEAGDLFRMARGGAPVAGSPDVVGPMPPSAPNPIGAMEGASRSQFDENRRLSELFTKQQDGIDTRADKALDRTQQRLTTAAGLAPNAEGIKALQANDIGGIAPTVQMPPKVERMGEGTATTNFDAKNTPTLRYTPDQKGTTVNLGDKTGADMDKELWQQGLKNAETSKISATTAAGRLANSQQVMGLIDQGAASGIVTIPKQYMGYVQQILGFGPGDSPSIEQLKQALHTRVISSVPGGPGGKSVSDADIRLEQLANGTMSMNPEVLRAIVINQSAEDVKKLSEHNESVGKLGTIRPEQADVVQGLYGVKFNNTPEAYGGVENQNRIIDAMNGKPFLAKPSGPVQMPPGTTPTDLAAPKRVRHFKDQP